jgi:hypothetical protein
LEDVVVGCRKEGRPGEFGGVLCWRHWQFQPLLAVISESYRFHTPFTTAYGADWRISCPDDILGSMISEIRPFFYFIYIQMPPDFVDSLALVMLPVSE